MKENESNIVYETYFLHIITYLSLSIFKNPISKKQISAVHGQQNIKRAYAATLVIPNDHQITKTAGFAYLAHKL